MNRATPLAPAYSPEMTTPATVEAEYLINRKRQNTSLKSRSLIRRVEGILLRVVVYSFLIAIISWSLPTAPSHLKIGFKERSLRFKVENFSAYLLFWNQVYVKPWVRKPLQTIGALQNWNMFAPNPIQHDVWVDAAVELSSGKVVNFAFPRVSQMGLVGGFINERYWKFIETAQRDSNAVMWPTLADYVAQQVMSTTSELPKKVTLKRHQTLIAPPRMYPPRKKSTHVFFETPVDLTRLKLRGQQ